MVIYVGQCQQGDSSSGPNQEPGGLFHIITFNPNQICIVPFGTLFLKTVLEN